MRSKFQMLPPEPQRASTVAEQVFDMLHEKILTLELPPGTKLSEVDVSTLVGVSRQPVREAFSRLSKLGFLLIRPQRATIVRPISEKEVLQAMYIRSALEIEVVRTAALGIQPQDLKELSILLEKQEQAAKAGERIVFHTLDDLFHKHISEAAGVGFVWAIIKENKAHMDRVRYLTLSFGTEIALNEHKEIYEAIAAKDQAKAVEGMRKHLSRIKYDLPRIRDEHREYFAEE